MKHARTQEELDRVIEVHEKLLNELMEKWEEE